jgi:DNA (cytosine-5)-methyltransferase 1
MCACHRRVAPSQRDIPGAVSDELRAGLSLPSSTGLPSVKALDFFCGAGGLTRGLLDAGIDVLCGVDNDDRLRATYETNNAPSRFEAADITDLDIHALRERHGVDSGDVVVYAACTPCQPFSTLNQRRGRDERKELLTVFAQIVAAAPPDFVLVENVPGLGNAYGREIYRAFVETLEAAGFRHDARKLDAQDYGVPQVRKRFLLIASRHGEIRLPDGDPGPPRTVRDAIALLPPPGGEGAPPNHVFREPRPNHLAILQQVPHDGGSRSDVKDTSLLLKCPDDDLPVHRCLLRALRPSRRRPRPDAARGRRDPDVPRRL